MISNIITAVYWLLPISFIIMFTIKYIIDEIEDKRVNLNLDTLKAIGGSSIIFAFISFIIILIHSYINFILTF